MKLKIAELLLLKEIEDNSSFGRKLKKQQQNSSFGRKLKKVSEYDQQIPQSQTADNPVAPRGRAAQPSRDTRKTN